MKKLIFFLLFLLPLLVRGQVIVTVAGGGGTQGDGGPATDAVLGTVYGLALDDSGNLYICDEAFDYRIRKVSPSYYGTITTIAGNGTSGYSGDGGLGIYAEIAGPVDVAVDHHGNVYFDDDSRIRKVTPADTITTIAGTGIAGYNGDGIPATSAQLNNPKGVTVDSIGNIYIADRYNYRIRKVNSSGIITTIAGTGIAGYSPDGSRADTAKITTPYSIRIDKIGNLFFYDSARIRKIDTAGIITTIAGNGIYGYSGDSSMATAAEIGGGAIAIDTIGNLFIADADANRVREVNTAGIIYTIAGDGVGLNSGDGGNPLLAGLCTPGGVAVNDSGDVFIGVSCGRVRLVTKHPLGVDNVQMRNSENVQVWPNPCSNHCTMLITDGINEQVNVVITNVTGTEVYNFSTLTNHPVAIEPDWPPGVYIISVITAQKHFTEKIIKE